MDRLTTEARSRLMAAVKGKNTRPELVVRKLAHSLGYRFRLHRNDLPGKPDLVFPSRKKVIFVHGCFWHRHDGCRLASTPKSRTEFWTSKFARNVLRDCTTTEALERDGWSVLIVWECMTRDQKKLTDKLVLFLDVPGVG